MRRLTPALAFSAVLVGLAPFIGELVERAKELLSSSFVVLMAVVFGLSIASLAAIHRVLLPWLDDLYHPRGHLGHEP